MTVATARRARPQRRPTVVTVRAYEPATAGEEREAERRWDNALVILARIGRRALGRGA